MSIFVSKQSFFETSKLHVAFQHAHNFLWQNLIIIKITIVSLFYNDFADRYYVGDALIEPMFWLVDHFTKVLGPVCVAAVIILSSSIITIAYVIGLPFYLKQSMFVLGLALLIGHWLLINVLFYYYKAFSTSPGYPPQGAMIAEAVSICKRCIAPKPPRTHHCVVCNRCILKMDHHCPWLNNCIGHFNHHYFFMFCTYSWIGIVFLISFGIPVAHEHFFGESKFSRICEPVINFIQSIAHHINFSSYELPHNISQHMSLSDTSNEASKWPETVYHSCIVFAALLCIAVLFVLGGLLVWHACLISNGETSIEGHINKRETKRLLKEGQVYKNPYDFGPKRNWKMFLNIGLCRPWWHILLPFAADPIGDGLQWNMLNDYDHSSTDQKESLICSIQVS